MRRSLDKDELFGIEIELAVEPFLVPLQNVGAILFGRVRCFFACDPAAREEPPSRAECDLGAVIDQKRLQLGQGDVGRCLVSVQDQYGVRPDRQRTPISALSL